MPQVQPQGTQASCSYHICVCAAQGHAVSSSGLVAWGPEAPHRLWQMLLASQFLPGGGKQKWEVGRVLSLRDKPCPSAYASTHLEIRL